MLEEKLKNIPKSSGCYLFKDKKGQIIYIGKAKHLPNRVKSYFSNKNHTEKTKMLVKNVSDVDFMTTLDENSAIILENDLIKSYKPKFNIKLKDENLHFGSVKYHGDEWIGLIATDKQDNITEIDFVLDRDSFQTYDSNDEFAGYDENKEVRLQDELKNDIHQVKYFLQEEVIPYLMD